jgi:hypothetical protein
VRAPPETRPTSPSIELIDAAAKLSIDASSGHAHVHAGPAGERIGRHNPSKLETFHFLLARPRRIAPSSYAVGCWVGGRDEELESWSS